jgi:dTDP-glucose 4,6-dehydratase
LQSIVDLGLDCHRIDVAGSSEEYGNIRQDMLTHYLFDIRTGGLILDESSPINPKSVYGTSKVAEDFLARNFHAAYGLPCVVTRMFNNYGPRQSPRFITGAIISQALEHDDIHLGYMDSRRDFCYVADGVMGHIHVGLFGNPGEVYVYGYGQNCSMLEWYEKIICVGRALSFWKDKTLHADTEGRARLGHSEVEELRVDYSKLHKLTGWRPIYNWEAGIALTIKWYAENRDRWIGRVDWK